MSAVFWRRKKELSWEEARPIYFADWNFVLGGMGTGWVWKAREIATTHIKYCTAEITGPTILSQTTSKKYVAESVLPSGCLEQHKDLWSSHPQT